MKAQRRYQHDPLVTPIGWKNDEKRFALRLTQLLDELYAKIGRLEEKVKALEEANKQ